MKALDGKVTIVAGGGTGIGRATAELFASEGARVVVFGRRPEPLAETVTAIARAGGVATAVSGDVSSEADVAKLVGAARAEYGGGGAGGDSRAGRRGSGEGGWTWWGTAARCGCARPC